MDSTLRRSASPPLRSSEWQRAARVCRFGRVVPAAIAHLAVGRKMGLFCWKSPVPGWDLAFPDSDLAFPYSDFWFPSRDWAVYWRKTAVSGWNRRFSGCNPRVSCWNSTFYSRKSPFSYWNFAFYSRNSAGSSRWFSGTVIQISA